MCAHVYLFTKRKILICDYNLYSREFSEVSTAKLKDILPFYNFFFNTLRNEKIWHCMVRQSEYQAWYQTAQSSVSIDIKTRYKK